ncbi:MAG: DNA repair protein RecO [Ilumatobacteraceae bacterium]
MTTYRDRGVVLRTYKLGESDRIVVLMTQGHGKVRAVAKGVRKTKSKIGARLEPMSHVDVLLNKGRELDVVNQVEVVDASPGLHGDLDRMSQAISMCEAVDLVSQDREPASHLYDMLVGALRTLEDKASPLLLAGFFLKLLASEGVGPQVERCVSCGGTDRFEHFDLHAGGVQCRSCATGIRVEDDVVEALQEILGGRLRAALDRPESPATNATTSLATRLMEHHLERRLKSSLMFGSP